MTVHCRNSNLGKQRTTRQDDEREKDNLSPRPTWMMRGLWVSTATSTSFIQEGCSPRSNPLQFSIPFRFWQKKLPHSHNSLKKRTSFTYLLRNGTSLFQTLETKLMLMLKVPFSTLLNTQMTVVPSLFYTLICKIPCIYLKLTKRFKIGSCIPIIQGSFSNAFCFRCAKQKPRWLLEVRFLLVSF